LGRRAAAVQMRDADGYFHTAEFHLGNNSRWRADARPTAPAYRPSHRSARSMDRDCRHLLKRHRTEDRIAHVRDDFAFAVRGFEAELGNIRAAHLEHLAKFQRDFAALR